MLYCTIPIYSSIVVLPYVIKPIIIDEITILNTTTSILYHIQLHYSLFTISCSCAILYQVQHQKCVITILIQCNNVDPIKLTYNYTVHYYPPHVLCNILPSRTSTP